MQHHQNNYWLGPFALISGLLISLVAAYFSIVGLSKLFTDSLVAGLLVFGTLEIGKLVSASWLFRNWKTSPRFLKWFMTAAVGVTMAITSLGIYGYLSNAYTTKSAPIAGKAIELNSLEQQMAIEQDRIKRATETMEQMNRSIDKLIDKDKTEQSLAARNRQKVERKEVQAEIKDATARLGELQKQKAGVQVETQQIANEVGPINFIAKAVFDDSQSSVDKAVQWLILMLVLVFDPLAIALLLAANYSFAQYRPEKKDNVSVLGPLAASKDDVKKYMDEQSEISFIPEKLIEADEQYRG